MLHTIECIYRRLVEPDPHGPCSSWSEHSRTYPHESVPHQQFCVDIDVASKLADTTSLRPAWKPISQIWPDIPPILHIFVNLTGE
jgi:hypothetical protein